MAYYTYETADVSKKNREDELKLKTKAIDSFI